jgi:hypothetical protein
MINVFEPQIDEGDIASVVKVPGSKWIGKSSVTQALELSHERKREF